MLTTGSKQETSQHDLNIVNAGKKYQLKPSKTIIDSPHIKTNKITLSSEHSDMHYCLPNLTRSIGMHSTNNHRLMVHVDREESDETYRNPG